MLPRRRVDCDAMSVTATFCATLVDEWVRAGLTDAVVSPGSRSTPLALALAGDTRLRTHVVIDERSAAFRALGMALASGRPTILLCTSGTAAVEYHAAVVEAHQAGVPLIVCTADRPPELQGVGAPQTIDQQGLFGSAVRWSASPGVPDDANRGWWRSLAARSVIEASGRHPGPVHLNLAFREPLGGEPGELPTGRDGGAPWHRTLIDGACGPDALDSLVEVLGGRRTLIVAGARCGDPRAIEALADAAGWPVVADPRSGCDGRHPRVVAAWESILRAVVADREWLPEMIVRFGEPPASKTLTSWIAAAAAAGGGEVVVRTAGRWIDPPGAAHLVVDAPCADLCTGLASLVAPAPPAWGDRWARASRSGSAALELALGRVPQTTGPGVLRGVIAALPSGSDVVVSSSLPIREVEWFATPRADVRVFANRGANGIDGVVSTSVGVATMASVEGRPTVAFLGDLAFLHDVGGLAGLTDPPPDLVVVVNDNSGGGIFSFLPQRSDLDEARFEQLFGTPHGVDVGELGGAYGATVHRPSSTAETVATVLAAITRGGLHLVIARTDRTEAVSLHADLHAAVAAGLAVES